MVLFTAEKALLIVSTSCTTANLKKPSPGLMPSIFLPKYVPGKLSTDSCSYNNFAKV